ncbi:GNAT family N-acetyltransferase [Streptomyces sp. NPDC096354]|uniref:GNAT family N-acetyltransferase n=1 Tax=Streptomyces sp. NPDC096354 TaxID=3366088 RepID=UPI0038145C04
MFTVQQLMPEQIDDLVVIQGNLLPATADLRDAYTRGLKDGKFYGVVEEGRVVGAYASSGISITVPGGQTVRAEIFSDAAVLPTHRRRGILRSMMSHHVQDAAENGASLSLLQATEPDIYGRFEYGAASMRLSLKIESRNVYIPSAVGDRQSVELTIMNSEAAIPLCEEIRRSLMSSRQGWAQREPANPDRWAGDNSLRYLMARRDGVYTGYARYSVRPDNQMSKGAVTVWEIESGDAESRREIWSFLLSLDLVDTVFVNSLPIDDPLLSMASDIRRCHITLQDDFYLRLLDIRAALIARQYASPIDVVLEVSDDLTPENSGRWHLTSDGVTSDCGRTEKPADLILAGRDLARTYLGGSTLDGLARAGRVAELRKGALRHASSALAVSEAPWIPTYI